MKYVADGYLTRAAVVLFGCLVGGAAVSPATAEAQSVPDSTAFPLVLDVVLDSIPESRADVRVEPRPLPADWEVAYGVAPDDLLDDDAVAARRLARLDALGVASFRFSATEDCAAGPPGYPRPVSPGEADVASADDVGQESAGRACVFVSLPKESPASDGSFHATVVVTGSASHEVFDLCFRRSSDGSGWEPGSIRRVLRIWS